MSEYKFYVQFRDRKGQQDTEFSFLKYINKKLGVLIR